MLLRPALLTIYKCFVKTHLVYGDIIYDEPFNNSFYQKIVNKYLSQVALEERRGKKILKTRFGVSSAKTPV